MKNKVSNKKLSENKKTWDAVAHLFLEASALPIWGPFGIGDDLDLIPKIKGKTFLEIACGSGRSIKYLINKGAKKIYGLDLSEKQIKEAEQFNKKAVSSGKVSLIHGEMEQRLKIEPVDTVYSVYGIRWTVDPITTFKNIYSYLKPGGIFIWSWDHTFFTDVQFEDSQYVMKYSYHDETPIILKNWKEKHGINAHITYRKTATWFQLLRDTGFEITGYYEPKPKTNEERYWDPKKYYSTKKAKLVPCSFIFKCRKPLKRKG